MTEKGLKVVVVGGGIGGLFAANALVARGFQVSVYEQAPNLGEVGAGVFLTPNSVRQLQRVSLGHAVHLLRVAVCDIPGAAARRQRVGAAADVDALAAAIPVEKAFGLAPCA